MFKKLWLLTAGITITNAFLTCVEAVQLTTEFYPANNIPKEYEKMADGCDMTVIKLEGWPVSNSISVSEKRLTSRDIKQCSPLRARAGTPSMQIVSSLGYTPGDPVTFTFKDSKIHQEITIVPNRLLAKSQIDGATVEAKICSVSSSSYVIELEGFGKNEEVLFKSRSYDEIMERKIKLSSNLGMGYMPGVVGQDGGIATISFTRASGEILHLELPWGLEWIKYIIYIDNDGKGKFLVDNEDFLREIPKVYEYFKNRLTSKNSISN